MCRTMIAALLVLAVPTSSFPHGGGLDKNGCHTNRKTGEYHCHGGGMSAPPPVAQPRVSATQLMSAGAVARPAPPGEASISSTQQVQLAQHLLASLGYDVKASGRMDLSTGAAARSFQKVHGLTPDGRITVVLLLALAGTVEETIKARR